MHQLEMLSAQVPVFEMGTDAKPAEIARMGLAKARAEDFDAIIVDTAGRLQVLKSPNHALVTLCSVAHCFTHLIILHSYRRPPIVSHRLPLSLQSFGVGLIAGQICPCFALSRLSKDQVHCTVDLRVV